MKRRVIVAMSGGVDSSVAAAMLAGQGYDVVGIAMRLAPEGEAPRGGRAACCSYEDFEDARRVAERMDFPFYVIDLRQDFARSVIEPFVGEYLAGRTPNPCLLCNRDIKFDRLWERAEALGADYVATGHYARIVRDAAGTFHLLRAADARKDQSYFLFTLSQNQLSRTLFPLGEMTKDEVRARARQLGLINADKPESQEICFVPDGNYAAFVEKYARYEMSQGDDPTLQAGEITTAEGEVIGEHGGLHRYTVGQRRGLRISAPEPLYVVKIDVPRNQLVVGKREALFQTSFIASGVNWIAIAPPAAPVRAAARVRYRAQEAMATITPSGAGRVRVVFDEAQAAITPGQAAVFYDGDRVVGGGWIETVGE